MEQGIQQLEKGHKDNLDELIDIYPYGDEGAKKGVYANMDKAIKKATTVISKHSMVHKVKGEKGKREVSNWIDDSYFVIGKSHFFKDELSSAHEIFDFIRVNYDYLPIRYDAAIWDIKVLLAKKRNSGCLLNNGSIRQ